MEEKTMTEEQEASDQEVGIEDAVKSVKLSPLKPLENSPGAKTEGNLDMLLDIHIPILVELGKAEMLVRDVIALIPGSIIELNSLAGEPVKITIRGKLIAQGEVVVVDENFAVKITKIAKPQDRIKSAG